MLFATGEKLHTALMSIFIDKEVFRFLLAMVSLRKKEFVNIRQNILGKTQLFSELDRRKNRAYGFV